MLIEKRVHLSIKGEWQAHKREWSQCRRCKLGPTATNHCLFRGSIPCDVLFVGEAPGADEDAEGVPFVGRSGELLQEWINFAFKDTALRYAITNVVACRPPNNRDPSPRERQACEPRLREFVKLAAPRMVVLVGAVARKHFGEAGVPLDRSVGIRNVYHPAYALRKGGRNSRVHRDMSAALREAVGEMIRLGDCR